MALLHGIETGSPMVVTVGQQYHTVPGKILRGRFRPLKKFEKFGIFYIFQTFQTFEASTFDNVEMARSVLVHFHIVESWKVRKTCPCCCNLGSTQQSSPDLQQRKQG